MSKRIFATNFWRQQDPAFSTVYPPPTSTFSRAGSAYRHYPYGDETRLEEAANDVLRCSWQRNPDTGLWIRGAHLEPGRTNLLTLSTDLSSWGLSNSSITDSSIILPDGAESDYDIIHEDNTPAAIHALYRGFGTVASSIYTVSAWYRAINRSVAYLYLKAGIGITFDLINGDILSSSGIVDYGMHYQGNGWWWCWCSFISSGGTHYYRIYLCEDDGNYTFDGLDQDSMYILWPQVEEGEFPSSRIDTAGAPVSRTQDSDYQVAAPLPAAKQGWLATKIYITPHTNSAEIPLLTLSDGGSATDRIRLAINTSQNLEVQSACSGGDGGLVEAGSVMDGRAEGHDVYITWRPGELCLALDGVFGTSDHVVSIPDNLDRLNIHPSGAIVGDVQIGDTFSRVPWRFLAAA